MSRARDHLCSSRGARLGVENNASLCEAYATAATRQHFEVLAEMIEVADRLRRRDLTAQVALPGALRTRLCGDPRGRRRHVGTAAWETDSGSVSCTVYGGLPGLPALDGAGRLPGYTEAKALVHDATDAAALVAAGDAVLAQLRQQLDEYRVAADAAHHAADVARAALLDSVSPAGEEDDDD